MPKHSVRVRGHKTSVSLDAPFWEVLGEAARSRKATVAALISKIDRERSYNNLSSALRLFALEYCRQRARGPTATAAPARPTPP